MADESVIIEIGVDDQGTPVLRNVTEEINNMDAATQQASKGQQGLSSSSQGATKSAKGMSPAMLAAGGAVAGVAAAAAAAGVALVGLVQGARAAIDAFSEQDEVNRGLERSLRNTGFAGQALDEEMESLGAAIDDVAVKTMLGDEELGRMAATFVNLSGEATATKEDLELMADISAATGKSGEEAARIYANAMEGNLQPSLARSTALTREQIEAINETEDESQRAALAQQALGDAFRGAAEDVNPLLLATKNLEDAQGDLMQMIGGVLAESGAFEPVIDAVTDAFRWLEENIDANREAIQMWIVNAMIAGVDAVQGFIERLQGMPQILGLVMTGAQQVTRNFMIWQTSIRTVINAAAAFGRAVVSGIVDTMRRVLDAGIAVADFLGRDVPHNVRAASGALNEMSDDLQRSMDAYIERAGEGVENIRDLLKDSAGIADDYARNTELAAQGLDTASGFADQLRQRLEEGKITAEEAAEEISRVGERRPREIVDDEIPSPAEQAAEVEDAADREVEAERRARDEIARIRIDAFDLQDEQMRLEEEARARVLELQFREMTVEEERLERMRIERQLEEDLAAVKAEIAEEERLQAEEASRLRQQEIDELERIRQAEIDATTAALNRFDRVIPGVGELINNVRILRAEEEMNTKAVEATAGAFGALAQVGSSMASMITDDRQKAAKIEFGFQTAAAAGAFAGFAASGFTAAPLGIAAAQHGVAAGKYAKIAFGGGGAGATSSMGAGAGAGGGGFAGMGARGAQMVDEMDTMEARPIEVNLDFSGATLLEDTPAIQREIRRAGEEAGDSILMAGRIR